MAGRRLGDEGDFDFADVIGKDLRGPDMQAPGAGAPAVSLDPVLREIAVDDIDDDENPRQFRPNPRYEEILESIRERGLQDKLVVTQKPGSGRYMLKKGGGTRRRALLALLDETGDHERWGITLAIVEPWEGMLDVIAGHFIENNLRSDVTFLENALSFARMHDLILEEDAAFSTASLRDRSARYASLGTPVSPTLLTAYDYTLAKLWPTAGTALRNGMGRPTIQEIRRVEKQLSDAVSARDESAVPDFPALFRQSLESGDGETFDLERYRSTLIESVASRLGCPMVELIGSRATEPRAPSTRDSKPVIDDASSEPAKDTERRARASAGASRAPAAPGPTAGSPPPAAAADTARDRDDDSEKVREQMLVGLREEACRIATPLAVEYGLIGGAFFMLEDPIALGFVAEAPDSVGLLEREDAADAVTVHLQLHLIFWSLLQVEIRTECLDGEAVLAEYRRRAEPAAIFGSETYVQFGAAALGHHLPYLRLRVAEGGASERERAMVERIDQLWGLAGRYAELLGGGR